MGEYARQYALERFGVDIGDGKEPIKQKPVKRFGCSCGRMFFTMKAKEQHQKNTGHGLPRQSHEPHHPRTKVSVSGG